MSARSAGIVRPGQHDDAIANAGRAQAQAIADRGDTEGIGIRQCARNAFQSVSVTIGLHHRHHSGRAGQVHVRAPGYGASAPRWMVARVVGSASVPGIGNGESEVE